MVVLLGLEFAALGAVASKLPAVRATARDVKSAIYSYVADENGATVVPSDGGDVASTLASPVRVTLRAIMLPELRGNAEAAEYSPLRHREILETLSNAVPRRFSGEVGGVWSLLFSTATDGTSISHMLRTVACESELLLVIRSGSCVFGAFVSELRDQDHSFSVGTAASSNAFYGTGETFLFSLAEIQLPPPPEKQLSSPSPLGGARSGRASIFAYTYRWSKGANEHFVRAGGDGIMLGAAGVGGVGLFLNAELANGYSGHCETYDNAPLPSVATPIELIAQDVQQQRRRAERASVTPSLADVVSPRSPGEAASATAPIAAAASASSAVEHEHSTPGAPAGSTVRFPVDALEVWCLDELKCRSLAACETHERVAMHPRSGRTRSTLTGAASTPGTK